MILINTEYSGNKKETEKIKFFVHKLNNGISEKFIVLDNIKSKSFISEHYRIPILFSLNRNFDFSTANIKIEELSNKFPNLKFKLINKNGYNIIAEGSHAELRKLPKYFNIGAFSKNNHFSRNELINLQVDHPFSIIENDNIIGNLSLDEFRNIKSFGFDTEFMFWETENNKKLNLNNLSTSSENIKKFLSVVEPNLIINNTSHDDLVSIVEQHFNQNMGSSVDKTYLKQPSSIQIATRTNDGFTAYYFQHLTGKNDLNVKNIGSKTLTTVDFKFDSGLEMVNYFQSFLPEKGIFFLISTNGMSYDFIQLRDFKRRMIEKQKKEKISSSERTSEFNFSGEKVKIKGQVSDIFKKAINNYVMHIDLTLYSKNYFPFSLDNKFETIISLILNKKVRKTEGYDELSRINIEQVIAKTIGKNPNYKELERQKNYAINDVLFLCEEQIEKYAKDAIFLKSNLFKTSPESVCFTSKKNLALNVFKQERLKQFLTPLTFTYDDYRNIESFKSFSLFEKMANLRFSYSKNVFDVTSLIYLAPFTGLFNKKLKNSGNNNYNNYMDYISNLGNSMFWDRLMKCDLINTLENGFLIPYVFSSKKEFFRGLNIENAIEKYSNFFRKFKPINNSENFFIFPREIVETEEFKQSLRGLGFQITNGKTISFGKGSFILYDDNNYFKRGIDAKGHLGFKSIYEIELLKTIIPLMFESTDLAINYISDFFRDLKQANLDRRKMIYYKENVAKDFFNYSSLAQKQSRIQAYIDEGIKKGQTFAKIELIDGINKKWYDVKEFLNFSDSFVFSNDNIELLSSKILGERTSNGRNLAFGSLGRYIEPLLLFYSIPKNEFVHYIETSQPERILKYKNSFMF